MKRILVILICIIVCVFSVTAQETVEAKSSLTNEIENKDIAEIIKKHSALFPNNTQLSISLIDGDNTTFIGIKRADDKLSTIKNEDAIFEIGSITKVFTSLLLAKQVQSNNMKLDEKMMDVIPAKNEAASQDIKGITLQMLSNHTSGLPRIAGNQFLLIMANQHNPYKEYTIELLNEYYAQEFKLDNKPNTTYGYSNLGAGTLGYILTLKTKMTYEELLQQDILKPLGMTNSSTFLSQIDNSKLVGGLNSDGSEAINWEFTDAAVGAGGIKSSALDMEKFMRKNFEEDAMYTLAQQPTFTVNPNFKLGLGWHISINKESTIMWHNGGTGGYRSCMVLDKENKKGVLVLSNVSAMGNQAAKIDALSFELLKELEN